MCVFIPFLIVPLSGVKVSVSRFRKVVFPVPFPPNIPKRSPFLKVYEKLFNNFVSLKLLFKSSTSRITPPSRLPSIVNSKPLSFCSFSLLIIAYIASFLAFAFVPRACGPRFSHSISFRNIDSILSSLRCAACCVSLFFSR